MQVKLPKELVKLMWAAKALKEIREGKNNIDVLRHNIYVDEYITDVEKFAGKPVDEIAREVISIDNDGERLIMTVKYFFLPLLQSEELRKKAMEQLEKIAAEIKTASSPKMMLYKAFVAALGDEAAAEVLTSIAESFLPDIEKYINK